MISQREPILVRLRTVMQVAGILTATRNEVRFDYQTTQLPACALLDGDEEADLGDYVANGRGVARHPLFPRKTHMTPYVLLQVGGKADEIGTTLNELADDIIDEVLGDDTLRSYTINRSGIRYDGMIAPRIEGGHVILNARQLKFTFSYIRRPGAVAATT